MKTFAAATAFAIFLFGGGQLARHTGASSARAQAQNGAERQRVKALDRREVAALESIAKSLKKMEKCK